jgi:serine/threonine-protein kinase ATR
MATLQTMVTVAELAEAAIESWFIFLSILNNADVGPYVGPTSAALVMSWPHLSTKARETAVHCIDHIVFSAGDQLGEYVNDIVDLRGVPEMMKARTRLLQLRPDTNPRELMQQLLERASSDNITVAIRALTELKMFMTDGYPDLIGELASNDIFSPLLGQALGTFLAASSRDVDGSDTIRLLAYECIGVLGALDPDRCEIGYRDARLIMLHNFNDEGESVKFALHLITDVLVGAYRSTSDIKYQAHLAYSIQELLRFCKFSPALVAQGNASVPIKVRNRWTSLPKHVLETVTPLLEARFHATSLTIPEPPRPIYPTIQTYREWIQHWTTHLITRVSGSTAQALFGMFTSAVRNKDVGVASHLLPHLILNIVISGKSQDRSDVRLELIAVLQDQVALDSPSSPDKKLFSAQVS